MKPCCLRPALAVAVPSSERDGLSVVYPEEGWQDDHEDFRESRIGDVPFERIGATAGPEPRRE